MNMAQDTAETIVVTIVPFHVLATMFMSLRLYSKHLSKAKYYLEDYVLILAWVRTSFHPATDFKA